MLWHLHLYKCGNPVRDWLSQHFGESWYGDTSPLDHVPMIESREYSEIYSAHKHWMKAYSSHRLTLACLDVPESTSLAVVRHPVDRFLSMYRYAKSDELKAYSPAKWMSAEEFVHDHLVELNAGVFIASQLNHLSGCRGLKYVREAVDAVKLMLFTFDNMGLIPAAFGVDGWIENRVSNFDEFPQSLKEQIAQLCPGDMALWDYANEIADR